MNKLYYIGYLMIFFVSCRGHLEKSRTEDKQYNTSHSRNYTHDGLLKLDTSSFTRSWHFYTDSNFRYHADSGLIGNNGWMMVYESGWQSNLLSAFQDSVGVYSVVTANTAVEEYEKRSPNQSFRFWSIVAVLGCIGYLLIRLMR